MNEPIKSVSPITGKAYSMPIGKDTTALSEFIHANQHKEIVAVQGLGFVGAAMSLVVANSDAAEYAVIGLDQKKSDSYWKIAEINLGLCPIISSDPLVLDLFEKSKIVKIVIYIIIKGSASSEENSTGIYIIKCSQVIARPTLRCATHARQVAPASLWAGHLFPASPQHDLFLFR